MPIDYSVRGRGEPLVLIHGLFGTRENLGAIARHLSEHYKVYSVDLPNHGRSAKIDAFDLESMARSLEEWMQKIDLHSAHFFGHSLGGKAAMELALTYPKRVQALVVADISPVTYEHRHEGVFRGLLSIDLDAVGSRVDADKILAQNVTEKAVRSFLLKNLQKRSDGKYQWRMNLPAIHRHYADLIKGNKQARFEGPVLFLKAENSDYIQSEHRSEIVERFPNTELKIVSNTGHWLHAEKPELIARLVNRFLQG